VIEDGELGVTKSFGVIRDAPLPAGVAFVAPVAGQIEIWNVKLQELKEIAAKMEGFLRETLEPQGFADSVQRTPFTVPLQ